MRSQPTKLAIADEVQAAEIAERPDADRVVQFLAFAVFTLSIGFFGAVTTISYTDPGFFDRMLIADIKRTDIDPISVGSTSKPGSDINVEAMPVPQLVRPRDLTPQDFAIVMVFGGEAHLASPGELWRVKVGSEVPGLGKILAIEESQNGGTIKTEKAVLTGIPQ
ncbi:hypothetical protein SAMN06297251_12946 [Fulvimarina manganoxydans]|uniref:Uncharacterized protein n=1 Tax=Fulvimarina manganoxydans TaxID=937218 RepID=A0A1W2EQB6_9HYPH|nr:hypothetical protein [Fulvimarina manganoxydans]SMD11446.1 hypothetical protein SAMN06297251_12946 [Fulvimarina manganoxydans]